MNKSSKSKTREKGEIFSTLFPRRTREKSSFLFSTAGKMRTTAKTYGHQINPAPFKHVLTDTRAK